MEDFFHFGISLLSSFASKYTTKIGAEFYRASKVLLTHGLPYQVWWHARPWPPHFGLAMGFTKSWNWPIPACSIVCQDVSMFASNQKISNSKTIEHQNYYQDVLLLSYNQGFLFQLCGVGRLVIIHKRTQPYLATGQRGKQKILGILLEFGSIYGQDLIISDYFLSKSNNFKPFFSTKLLCRSCTGFFIFHPQVARKNSAYNPAKD